MRKITPCKNPGTYYIWLGGSCDYSHPARYGGGACIIEYNGSAFGRYVISDTATTEFRMMLTVMLHVLQTLPAQSTLCFLTNVAYLQNYDKTPTDKSANADLIRQCIAAKERHAETTLKLIPYHKYPQLPATHELAHHAMLQLRTPR